MRRVPSGARKVPLTPEEEAWRAFQEEQERQNAVALAARQREVERAALRKIDGVRLAIMDAQTYPALDAAASAKALAELKGQFLVAVSELRACRYGTERQDEPDPELPAGLAHLPLSAEWAGLDDLLGKRVSQPTWREAAALAA